MSVTQTRWVLAGLLLFWIILLNVFPGESRTIGVSAQWSNGDYRFAGGTDPAALAMAVLFIGGYFLAFNTLGSENGKPVGGVFRRFVAFWLDFAIAMFAITPVLGVVPAVLEWNRTHTFQWHFERNVVAKGDSLQVSALLLLTFAGLVCYNIVPILGGRPSPGACIMGYRVVRDNDASFTFWKASLRTVVGFIAVCGAYLAPFIARDKKNGKFWLDKVFSTHATAL